MTLDQTLAAIAALTPEERRIMRGCNTPVDIAKAWQAEQTRLSGLISERNKALPAVSVTIKQHGD